MTDIPQGSPWAAALDMQRKTPAPDRTTTICGPIRASFEQPSTSESGRGLFDWLFKSSEPNRHRDPYTLSNCFPGWER